MSKSNQKKQNKVKDNILNILGDNVLTPSDIESELKNKYNEISRATLIRKLNSLIEDGFVLSIGEGRGRVYKATTKTKQLKWFDTPPQLRPTILFRRDLLENYIPNQTYWLSEKQREQLNEIQPNCDQPANTYARKISQKLMVEFSYFSSKLEGNTYSLAETKELLLNGNSSDKRSNAESVMLLNHKRAIEYIINLIDPHQNEASIINFNGDVDSRLIRDIHYLLSDGLVYANQRGGIRHNIIEIGGSSYKPETSPQILGECLELICHKSNLINNPFEKSLFLMTTIPYLQPFVDVNKRTGRLISNLPLLFSGLAPLSFKTMDREKYVHGLLQFYELGNPNGITEAFFEAYTSSAHIYKVAVGRSNEEIKIHLLYRKEIKKSMVLIAKDCEAKNKNNLNLNNFLPKNILNEHVYLYKKILEDNLLNISRNGAKLDGFPDEIIEDLIKVKEMIISRRKQSLIKRKP